MLTRERHFWEDSPSFKKNLGKKKTTVHPLPTAPAFNTDVIAAVDTDVVRPCTETHGQDAVRADRRGPAEVAAGAGTLSRPTRACRAGAEGAGFNTTGLQPGAVLPGRQLSAESPAKAAFPSPSCRGRPSGLL